MMFIILYIYIQKLFICMCYHTESINYNIYVKTVVLHVMMCVYVWSKVYISK